MTASTYPNYASKIMKAYFLKTTTFYKSNSYINTLLLLNQFIITTSLLFYGINHLQSLKDLL